MRTEDEEEKEEEERPGGEEEEQREEEEEGLHLVVAAAAIGEDLDAAQSQEDVRSSRREQLLARLWCQSQIPTWKATAGRYSATTKGS